MADDAAPPTRHGEAVWRAHDEASKRSDLNQRECCQPQGVSLKALGNWRAKFKSEPQPPGTKLSEVALRYGIARRVLCRWRQEQAAAAMPTFVDVVRSIDREAIRLQGLPSHSSMRGRKSSSEVCTIMSALRRIFRRDGPAPGPPSPMTTVVTRIPNSVAHL